MIVKSIVSKKDKENELRLALELFKGNLDSKILMELISHNKDYLPVFKPYGLKASLEKDLTLNGIGSGQQKLKMKI